MAPRNRFESEYTANYKPHEVTRVLSMQLQPQSKGDQQTAVKDTSERGLKNKDGLLKPSQTSFQESRALQYKAGLAPSVKTSDKLRYLSEYKKEFDWKKPLDYEAPILSAEKMIYGLHGHDHPVNAVKVKLPKKTEYQLQFVKHPIISIPKARKELDKTQHNEHDLLEWKEPSVPAGKPSKKPSQPSSPVPKRTMVFQSEYHANFKSPSLYEYIKGSWVGACHPQHPHLDEISDSENKPTSNAWYQQVIELREKVLLYKARAREGSHFIGLLKKLKENGILETPNKDEENTKEKPIEELPGHTPERAPQNGNDELNAGFLSSTQGVVRDEKEQENQAKGGEKTSTQQAQNEPITNNDPISNNDPKQPPKSATPKSFQSQHDQENVIPSNLENPSDNQEEHQTILRRQAWPAENRNPQGCVKPPFGVSSSSATTTGLDSRSDISISEIEALSEEDGDEPERQAISSSTKKLITGRRNDLNGNKETYSFDGDEPDRQAIPSSTKKLFTGRRKDFNEDKKTDSFSSDDETSISSYSSNASDLLSVESMEKRKAIASETLRRARRRQAQL